MALHRCTIPSIRKIPAPKTQSEEHRQPRKIFYLISGCIFWLPLNFPLLVGDLLSPAAWLLWHSN